MRSSNSGLAHGTNGSPQSTIESGEYAAKVAKIEKELEEDARKPMVDEDLVQELEKSGAKFSRKDIVFITRDETGQIVWLENGSSSAGLNHILYGNGSTKGHAGDFKSALGLSESEVPGYLYRVITHGRVESSRLKLIANGRMGYTRVYFYSGRYNIITGIGTNGFIASAYPTKRSGER